MIIHQPKNQERADKLYAFLSQEADGTEGIVAHGTVLGMTPLVSMSGKNLDQMTAMAKETRRLTGKPIVLAEFTRTNTTSI